MTPEPGREALAAIVAGTEGVTLGPYVIDGNPDRAYLVYTDDVTGSLLARLGGSGFEFVRRSSAEIAATTAHFSRLDPATMRSIADYVAALEAQVEGMRAALEEAVLALDGLAKGEGVFKPIEQTIVLARAALQSSETTGEK